ncbi:VOC family protein [Nocardia otitidiscaviarum]|nr:glyoxalase [Nocardia otitidiscaviarum]MBF6179483.1 glyoxalase [Nocardia otitidiscaviarum]MCP9621161.1 glyoxalase [Nocardia otitidiscaviarum]
MNSTMETKTDITVHLEVADPDAARATYDAAFGLGDRLQFRAGQEPSSGFRGFMLSLVVAQPGTVDSLIATALDAGFTTLKPAKKTFWGYGGVIQAPEGTIWKITSSNKKNTGPVTREVDSIVLLLGVENVKATKQFYVDHGLPVGKSFGSKYVEFATPGSTVTLALYGRRAAAKDAGVDPEGAGSHRIVIGGDTGTFTDPDGFVWESDAV